MGCGSVLVLAAIGYFVLGKWGALLGFIIGAMLAQASPRRLRLNDLGLAFLQCLAKLAKADGRISEQEAELIGEFIRSNYPPELHPAVKKAFNAARDDDRDFAYYCDRFAQCALVQLDYDSRCRFMLLFCSLAARDGQVSEAERRMLDYAERALRVEGFVAAFFERGGDSRRAGMSRSEGMSAEECCRILGCDAACSAAELKKAYRAKCAEFHPDRLQAKGLPRQFIEYAEEEMKRINQAYDTLKRMRGI